jgi:hypothetical protein
MGIRTGSFNFHPTLDIPNITSRSPYKKAHIVTRLGIIASSPTSLIESLTPMLNNMGVVILKPKVDI